MQFAHVQEGGIQQRLLLKNGPVLNEELDQKHTGYNGYVCKTRKIIC